MFQNPRCLALLSYLLPGPLTQCFSHRLGIFFFFFLIAYVCIFSTGPSAARELELSLSRFGLQGPPPPTRGGEKMGVRSLQTYRQI